MKRPSPRVALNLSRRIAGRLAFARSVADAMAGNPDFPSPTVPLETFRTDIAALEAAVVAVLSRAKGTADERNVKLSAVRKDLDRLAAYVQRVADGDPSRAEAIITSAGMSVKGVGTRTKNELQATGGPVSGSVHLVAKAAARRASYEWQYATDKGAWVNAPPTLGASTDLEGLNHATYYFFRYRSVTKAGASDWSEPVSLLVK